MVLTGRIIGGIEGEYGQENTHTWREELAGVGVGNRRFERKKWDL
jgi:hypothetical protein